MRLGRALLAGVAAGAARILIISVVAWTTHNGGVDLAVFVGSMITGEMTAPTWIMGFILYLLVSGLIALLYAIGFEIARKAGWRLGLIGGLIHAAVGGFTLLILPAIHPAMPQPIRAPGAFGAHYGPGAVVGFIVATLAYGAVVGAIYRPANVPVAPPVDLETSPEDHHIGAGAHGTRWH